MDVKRSRSPVSTSCRAAGHIDNFKAHYMSRSASTSSFDHTAERITITPKLLTTFFSPIGAFSRTEIFSSAPSALWGCTQVSQYAPRPVPPPRACSPTISVVPGPVSSTTSGPRPCYPGRSPPRTRTRPREIYWWCIAALVCVTLTLLWLVRRVRCLGSRRLCSPAEQTSCCRSG